MEEATNAWSAPQPCCPAATQLLFAQSTISQLQTRVHELEAFLLQHGKEGTLSYSPIPRSSNMEDTGALPTVFFDGIPPLSLSASASASSSSSSSSSPSTTTSSSYPKIVLYHSKDHLTSDRIPFSNSSNCTATAAIDLNAHSFVDEKSQSSSSSSSSSSSLSPAPMNCHYMKQPKLADFLTSGLRGFVPQSGPRKLKARRYFDGEENSFSIRNQAKRAGTLTTKKERAKQKIRGLVQSFQSMLSLPKTLHIRGYSEEEPEEGSTNNASLRAIYRVDDEGGVLDEFISLRDAERTLGLRIGSICNAMHNKGKHPSGYKFRYKSDDGSKYLRGRKPVIHLNDKGELIAEYSSVNVAVRRIGIPSTLVTKILNREKGSKDCAYLIRGKLQWKHATDFRTSSVALSPAQGSTFKEPEDHSLSSMLKDDFVRLSSAYHRSSKKRDSAKQRISALVRTFQASLLEVNSTNASRMHCRAKVIARVAAQLDEAERLFGLKVAKGQDSSYSLNDSGHDSDSDDEEFDEGYEPEMMERGLAFAVVAAKKVTAAWDAWKHLLETLHAWPVIKSAQSRGDERGSGMNDDEKLYTTVLAKAIERAECYDLETQQAHDLLRDVREQGQLLEVYEQFENAVLNFISSPPTSSISPSPTLPPCPSDLWVQCDACEKWRRLAADDEAPQDEKWYCSMNTSDPRRSTCEAGEEPVKSIPAKNAAVKGRHRCVHRMDDEGNVLEEYVSLKDAERLLSLSVGSVSQALRYRSGNHPAGYKFRYTNADCILATDVWIQCDACDKWRRAAKDDVPHRDAKWFCSMNTSDPLRSTCDAEEEQAFNPIHHHRAKPVVQLTGDGLVQREFVSAIDAAEELGVSKNSIRRMCNGVQKATQGYYLKWKYDADSTAAETSSPFKCQKAPLKRKQFTDSSPFKSSVGVRIRKLFAEGWFGGSVESFNSATQLYTVCYDDGDEEELDVSDMRPSDTFEVLQEVTPQKEGKSGNNTDDDPGSLNRKKRDREVSEIPPVGDIEILFDGEWYRGRVIRVVPVGHWVRFDCDASFTIVPEIEVATRIRRYVHDCRKKKAARVSARHQANDSEICKEEGAEAIENECPICLEPIENSDRVKLMICGHCFCRPCFDAVTDFNARKGTGTRPTRTGVGLQCPLCRRDTRSGMVVG